MRGSLTDGNASHVPPRPRRAMPEHARVVRLRIWNSDGAPVRSTIVRGGDALIRADACSDDVFRGIAAARRRGDARAVHELRKAAAKLRTFCELVGEETLASDLRWLRRSAAGVRDVDVVVGLDPPKTMTRWLAKLRRSRLTALRRSARPERIAALRAALARLPEIPRGCARRAVDCAARRVRRRGEPLGPRSTPAEVHALRRALRRLRFAREWAGRGTKEIQRVLDALGALNDLATARRLAEQCPARRDLAQWRGELDSRIAAASRDALAAWERHARRRRGR